MSEVGIPPPHDLDKPHALVDRNQQLQQLPKINDDYKETFQTTTRSVGG